MKKKNMTSRKEKALFWALILFLALFMNSTFSFAALDVFIQDQTSPPVDFFFTQIQGAPTVLAANTSINDLNVTVLDSSSCAVGDYFGAFDRSDPEDNRAYFGSIQSIVLNNITLDTPLDYPFIVGNTVACFDRNLNVLGTPGAPQIYSIRVGPNSTQSIDITRLLISFITDSTVDLNKFGDLTSLTNGLILRRTDGVTRNIWNVKNNGEIANLCYDYAPYSSTNPNQGQDGAKFRCTFAGQEKHGVTIRIDPGDELQLIIQDDLTGLNQFRVVAQGHYVDDTENNSVYVEDIKMLGIVFLLIAIGACLGYLGVVFIKTENKDYKVQYQLIGSLFWCAVLLIGWILTFIVMIASEGQNYYEVIRMFFYIYSVLAGLTAGAGFIVISMILIVMVFIKIFGADK